MIMQGKRTNRISSPSRARAHALTPREVPGVGLGVLLRNADMTFNRVFREHLARLGVTFSQFQHLWQLYEHKSLSQAELSRLIGIETASSTGVIEQLERQRLIRRVRDQADRRRIIVTLTDSGRALEKPLTRSATAINALARRGVSPTEIKLLQDTLERIMQNLGRHAVGRRSSSREL
jgi:DNA-binding MarR family transcriptional regulator